ncbi:NUDIX domain-containing protein [Streptomyces sp. NBC_01565]|uniref:NUDIX hydrolase n=1 Tax=unclassified Streptomyces TaxID=2593676 RepID=UPI0022541908|nr:NUDIX domain-containing protein [Streptomyces sp. NBC_01565]MCX4546883.1 NUDIX domain-containing protein [Streptomyces sp. NBC_01565]
MTVSDDPRGTAALLVDPRGRYLLHLRDANKRICDPGTWSIPGGDREGAESSREAVERELLEETGLVVPLEEFTVVDSRGPDGVKGRIRVYLGAWDGDADQLPCPEGIMFRHFDAGTVRYLTMCPWTKEVIDLHQAQSPALSPVPVPAHAGGQARLNVVGVHLYLEQDGKLLLGLRHPDSAYAAATHHFLAGHCEQESAVACLVREAQEEAGITIDPADVELAHVVHVVDHRGGQPRMQLVFRARRWTGMPQVREPDRCVSWDWWPADALPDRIVAYTRAAIDGIRAGRLYTEMGW